MNDRTLRKHLELLASRPFFDVELSALCNLNCPTCPRDSITRAGGLMPPEILEALPSWIPPGSRVAFSGLGEPLLHPEAAAAAAALKAAGSSVGLVTNATLLDGPALGALLEAGLDFLEVSFLGSGPSGAAAGGSLHEGLAENLAALAAQRPPSMKAYLSVVLTGENRERLPQLRAFAKSLRLTPLVRPLHSRGGALYAPPVRGGGCGLFAKVSFVAWNGDLLACCNDTAGSTRLGNLKELSHAGLLRLKEGVLRSGAWFGPCPRCDDSHRRKLLDKPLPGGL